MPNHLAIATATEALRQMILEDLTDDNDLTGVKVESIRPESNGNPPTGPEVRIFLYQVTPNPTWRNNDLPTRRGGGTVIQRSQVALDLHYLLTFSGNEPKHEPQRMLGRVARLLHSQPLLTAQQIQKAKTHASLITANLEDQTELVKFSPIPLTLEELSKLWSIFFQSPYALSMAYQAAVVFIETEDTPTASLPVVTRNLRVIPFQQSVIEKISPQIAEAGEILTLKGQNIKSELMSVVISDFPNPLQALDPIKNNEIKIQLPPALRAGIHTVRIVHEIDFNTGAAHEPHRALESNLAVFVLRPTITGKEDQLQQLTISPEIAQTQRVQVLLNENVDSDPNIYRLDVSLTGNTTTITIPGGVEPGSYFVRVKVDDAESQLNFEDPNSPDFGPIIQIS